MSELIGRRQAGWDGCGEILPTNQTSSRPRGHIRFEERPRILREVRNLDRKMYLVQFEDGATTFVFPHEIIVE